MLDTPLILPIARVRQARRITCLAGTKAKPSQDAISTIGEPERDSGRRQNKARNARRVRQFGRRFPTPA
jgi:hypothetical protein